MSEVQKNETRPAGADPSASPSDSNEDHAPQGSPSEQEALLQKIQELEAECQEKENKYKYLYADFENYKKRMIKERSDLVKFGWESLAHDLLLVIDNMERALFHAENQATAENKKDPLLEGLKMVLNQFSSALERQGVTRIQTQGASFDPHLHEAVEERFSEEHPEGQIMDEQMKGYTLHGRLLRPAKVIVSKKNDK